MKIEIKDDFSLLKNMINDSRLQLKGIYNPGPYWEKKIKNSLSQIQKNGIQNFRSSSNGIGLSYADNLIIDVRDAYTYGYRKILNIITRTFPFSDIFDLQVKYTRSHADEFLRITQELLNQKKRVRELLEKYTLPYSLLGGCMRTVTINEKDYAVHYLNLLEQHDNIAALINFNKIRTVFEIGGGFGVNIHLLIENYKNIRKVVYLDIAPNLYVGTQYLKAFYGKSVYDYNDLKKLDEIKFSNNDDLEIFCITPWLIEKLQTRIDILMNSNSFVEMTEEIVSNYANQFMRLPNSEESIITLITYDKYDTLTIDPACLPQFFFDREFKYYEFSTLLNESRKSLYYLSFGKTN